MATNTDYGRDISGGRDLDPLARDVTGEELMAQALLRRAITRQGMLIGCPLYGLGLLDLLNEETYDGELEIIAAQMAAEFEKDERVLSCQVKASSSNNGEDYAFEVQCEGADGPFRFVLGVSDVTVELLKVGI